MLEIVSKNLVGFIAEMPLSGNLFRLGFLIKEHADSKGAAPVGGSGGPCPLPIKTKLENFVFYTTFFFRLQII